ncbi:MAG: YgjV family protein [Oscillospiraceae bacterium]|nr:YgjV family protein [Oscillospiraceae bacterium]
MVIISQILGLGAMLSLFLIYQQKSRKKMLFAKLSADVCWVAHYLCLGGIAGMIPNAVGIFRELIFINRKDKRWAASRLWPILFILINWALGARTFHSLFNILPIAASTFVTISLWIDNPRLTKIISLPVSLAFMTYNFYIGSYVGVINEAIAIISIILSFAKERKADMKNKIFSSDCAVAKELKITEGAPIADVARTITADVSAEAVQKGDAFAKEIADRFVSDFEKPGDKMAHVSTFIVIGDTVYMTYYANTKEPSEDPKNQTARLVYAPKDDIDNKTFIDLQTTGDIVGGKVIDMVYDTILMQKDDDTIYIMWTARTEENYYRFYCPFTLSTKTLGEVGVNRFKVGDTVNDFSISGIKSALAQNDIPCKKMYSDIGIMQKLSSRVENGERYYYSGTYSGDFTAVIKSKDLITWEYVSQPDFINDSKWENATYVLGDKVYYFVRQQDTNKRGFLTVYNLLTNSWEKAVEIEDCQSRGDFILYNGGLYLFHAPIDREHIGIVKIDTEDIAKSEVVLQANMQSSCFYPFVQYFDAGELAMSYTVERKHIRLASFDLSKYL